MKFTRAAGIGLLVDVVCILIFALLGRRSHGESSALAATFTTAWPFLTGTAAGWLAAWTIYKRPPLRVSHGVLVWLLTITVGMALRAATGAGTAWSFVFVALAVSGMMLLGWRALWMIVADLRTKSQALGEGPTRCR